MKLPCPIKVHSGLKPTITQKYGNTSLNDWYSKNGINAPFHNGLDVTLGDPKQTYGSELITLGKDWQIVKTIFDTPLSTKGNGITIESPSFVEDGINKKLQVVYWHCSKVEQDKPRQPLPEYTTVAYVGNSGTVSPPPTTICPYCGSHLHLMLFEFHQVNGLWVLQNANNGVNGAIDPMDRFDFNWLIQGQDDISFDNAPIQWAFDKLQLTEVYQKIIYLYKTFIK